MGDDYYRIVEREQGPYKFFHVEKEGWFGWSTFTPRNIHSTYVSYDRCKDALDRYIERERISNLETKITIHTI